MSSLFFFFALRTLECSFNWHQSFLNGMLALKNVIHIIKIMHKWIQCKANEYLQRRHCRLSFDFRYIFLFVFFFNFEDARLTTMKLTGKKCFNKKKMWTYVSELSQVSIHIFGFTWKSPSTSFQWFTIAKETNSYFLLLLSFHKFFFCGINVTIAIHCMKKAKIERKIRTFSNWKFIKCDLQF